MKDNDVVLSCMLLFDSTISFYLPCVCVCVCVCMCVCMRACVRVCVCVQECQLVLADYYDDYYEDSQPVNCSTAETIRGGNVSYSEVKASVQVM